MEKYQRFSQENIRVRMRVTVILCVGLGGIMGWEEGVGGRSYKAVAIRAGVPLAEHGFHHCGLTLGGRLGHILKEGGWVGRSSRGGGWCAR